MVHGDLIQNKTELMLNGDLMFNMKKKDATVLSPPPELAEKQVLIDKETGKVNIKLMESGIPVPIFES